MILTFESVGEILSVTIHMKATEQYFSVVLFIMLVRHTIHGKVRVTVWRVGRP